jgi:hypothetical protein
MLKVRFVAIASGLFWIVVALGWLYGASLIMPDNLFADLVVIVVAAFIGLFGFRSIVRGFFASDQTLAHTMKLGDHPDFQ